MHESSLLLSVGQVAKLFGVCTKTIRRWCATGRLKVHLRTVGQHRRFRLADLEPLLAIPQDQRKVIGYARVSSHDQKNDLVTQSQRLSDWGCDEVIADLGSGLNCKKPGLKRLLSRIHSGQVKTLVLINEDRLLRFGTEVVFWLCRKMGTDVTILEKKPDASFEEELVKDVITLMTVFCARLYGRRSNKNQLAKG